MASFLIPTVTSLSSTTSNHRRSFPSFPIPLQIVSAGGLCLARHTRARALTMDFSGSFFEEGRNGDDGPSAASAVATVEEKDEPQCPPGLRQYETMVVLRPDMSEEERLGLTERYEEVNLNLNLNLKLQL